MAIKTSYFYVLLCQDGTFYGGYTTDLKRREKEHNDGVGAKYTKPLYRRPLKMIYAAGFPSRSEATKAEYAFKKQTKAKKIAFLKQAGIEFPIKKTQVCIVDLSQAENEKEG
ncbi:GIY-YIG nuclease family protein [Carnobacterium divergens]|uniref:GIY-YIG domain-containing protein n=1 Tax=Carnobacterium divergens TaxID=2748 RepID=A0A7Z8G5F0_CARDV|nr:GIY-YIG nuclease family protein [Carnobacterium divergens]TFI72776.1 hypothetical protein CKN58_07320 [Carnobacterium divergens]TFI77022.1 hypothetical protein CKN85_07360 [Carnobacterium divergens]TFI83517.1 hypothetical protein CKN56_07400 [Carnobacterium divergens]TFI95621.1 hypothetical protein CKN64_07340 [Carnobacterium divergens]TFJ11769.1 hypothetical protein CKN60_07410 [Carnobacterium divergens]